jgi:hypothetical protein
MALTQATKEGIWIRRLLSEIGFGFDSPTIIRSIALAKNSVHHARTKHIDIQHHFVREKVESDEVELVFCRTEDMVADILTKGSPRKNTNVFQDRWVSLTRRVGV